jgi:hypothetical protein
MTEKTVSAKGRDNKPPPAPSSLTVAINSQLTIASVAGIDLSYDSWPKTSPSFGKTPFLTVTIDSQPTIASVARINLCTKPHSQSQSTANLRLSLWLESNRPSYDSWLKTLLPSSPSSPRAHRLANLSKSGKVFLVLLGQTRRPRIVR